MVGSMLGDRCPAVIVGTRERPSLCSISEGRLFLFVVLMGVLNLHNPEACYMRGLLGCVHELLIECFIVVPSLLS